MISLHFLLRQFWCKCIETLNINVLTDLKYNLYRHRNLFCYNVWIWINFFLKFGGVWSVAPNLHLMISSLQHFQQTIMGNYRIYGVQCTFAYAWEGTSIVFNRELPSICRGSTEGWAPACWCMTLKAFSILAVCFFHLLFYITLLVQSIAYSLTTVLHDGCRYHFSH